MPHFDVLIGLLLTLSVSFYYTRNGYMGMFVRLNTYIQIYNHQVRMHVGWLVGWLVGPVCLDICMIIVRFEAQRCVFYYPIAIWPERLSIRLAYIHPYNHTDIYICTYKHA